MGGITTMAKTWVRKAFIVLTLALVVSPIVVSNSSSASSPAVKPGEILDLPACEGLETWRRYVLSDTPRRMIKGIDAFGEGTSPAESRFTEQVGNVIVRINRAEAPKGTTRFQLRYFIGNHDKSGDGPYHAKFFKNEYLRIRIPNAKLDTYFFFQVAAVRGDCILYTGGILERGTGVGPYLSSLWCSVPRKKWLVVKDFLGNRTTRCPTAPIMRYEQEEGA